MAETYKVRAFIKGIDQTPRKMGVVASLVRGRSVADAVVILTHTPRRSALAVKKALKAPLPMHQQPWPRCQDIADRHNKV